MSEKNDEPTAAIIELVDMNDRLKINFSFSTDDFHEGSPVSHHLIFAMAVLSTFDPEKILDLALKLSEDSPERMEEIMNRLYEQIKKPSVVLH